MDDDDSRCARCGNPPSDHDGLGCLIWEDANGKLRSCDEFVDENEIVIEIPIEGTVS